MRAGMPMIAGVPNRAIVSRKTMIIPARIAGQTSGSVTVTIVRHVPAPRMLAASSISEETMSRAALTKMKMNGNEFRAMTTARPVNGQQEESSVGKESDSTVSTTRGPDLYTKNNNTETK